MLIFNLKVNIFSSLDLFALTTHIFFYSLCRSFTFFQAKMRRYIDYFSNTPRLDMTRTNLHFLKSQH
jgi:hypothetical protein